MPKQRRKRHPVTQPLDQSYRLIPLTQGQTAIVDAEDFDKLDEHNWSACWGRRTKSWYAIRGSKGKREQMHRVVMGNPIGKSVDHKNHDTLDNRKINLRACSVSENLANMRIPPRNKSGYKGVCWHKPRNNWICHISINNRNKYLGSFRSKEEAARAYDAAAKERFGDFALLNFPD